MVNVRWFVLAVLGTGCWSAKDFPQVDTTGPTGPTGSTGIGVTGSTDSGCDAASSVLTYTFSEDGGTTVTDISPELNHGTNNGGAWVPSGKHGGGMHFDGNSFISVSDDALDVTRVTLAAWVKLDSCSNGEFLLGKDDGATERSYFLSVLGSAGGNHFRNAVSFTGDTVRPTLTGATCTAGTWTHVAMTFDGSVVRSYINGIEDGTNDAPGAIHSSGIAVTIGRGGSTGGFNPFTGTLDDVCIYDYARSPAQITADSMR